MRSVQLCVIFCEYKFIRIVWLDYAAQRAMRNAANTDSMQINYFFHRDHAEQFVLQATGFVIMREHHDSHMVQMPATYRPRRPTSAETPRVVHFGSDAVVTLRLQAYVP